MEADFSSAKALLRRANFHIVQFEVAANQFVGKKPCAFFTEYDAGSGLTNHKVKITEPIPVLLPLLVFDCVNALRSALDHAVYDATTIITGDASLKYTKFPSGKTRKQAEDDIARKNGQVPPELGAFLLTFEPYEDGNPIFRNLSEIRNGKIHRTLQAAAFAYQSLTVTHMTSGMVLHINDTPSEWDSAKQELTYLRTSQVTGNIPMEVTITITLGESTPDPGKPALEVLRSFAGEAVRIVSGIEAETARILTSLP